MQNDKNEHCNEKQHTTKESHVTVTLVDLALQTQPLFRVMLD